MKAVKTWIIVADGARARVLCNDGPGKGIHQLVAMAAETTDATHELGSERPGRVNESVGSHRHAIQPRVDRHEAAEKEFANRIAHYLDENAEQHSYERLVLVAPAKTLGYLRAGISKNSARLVTGEVTKDLTHTAIADLPAHLADVMAL